MCTREKKKRADQSQGCYKKIVSRSTGLDKRRSSHQVIVAGVYHTRAKDWSKGYKHKLLNTIKCSTLVYRFRKSRHYSKTDDNGNAMLHSFLHKTIQKKSAEDTLVPPRWEKRGGIRFILFYFLLMRLHAAEPVLRRCNCQHANQERLTWR